MGRTMSVLAFLAELPGFENSRNVEMTTYDYGKILADPGEGLLILYDDYRIGVFLWNG
jgi:hypothetical protein